MTFIIEPLTARHDREAFDCAEPSLNEYLKLYARQNDSKGIGKTYVAVETLENVRISGYYTIATGGIAADNLPENLPRYQIPVVHLGRLAVDRAAQGKGLGEILLLDALRRAVKIAEQIGIFAVEVRALTAAAKRFYLKFGFVELNDDELHLYISIKKIRKLGLI